MDPSVRPATLDESSEIARLAARTFALACPPTASPTDISAFIAAHLSPENFAGYISDPQRQVAVAVRGTDTIGYTMVILGEPSPDVANQLTAAPTAELSKIYVDPDHHGGGTARALFDHAVAGVRDAGRAAIWLGTNQANRRAQRFYEKSGFTRVGTKRFRLGDTWEDDFIYELIFAR